MKKHKHVVRYEEPGYFLHQQTIWHSKFFENNAYSHVKVSIKKNGFVFYTSMNIQFTFGEGITSKQYIQFIIHKSK